jgi:hypothetical protein
MADFGRALNAAAPGLGRLAMAIGGSGGPLGAYQQAYDNQLGLQSKLAQAMASIEAHGAAAEASRAKAKQDDAETSIISGRGDVGDELLAAAAGTDIPTVRAYREQLRTGKAATTGSPTGYPEIDEQIGIRPSPVVSSAVAQAIAKHAPRTAVYRTSAKDMKADDLAKAESIYREGDLSDAIIAGTGNRNTIAGAQAAAGGKALFHADSTGAVLDQFTGGLDTSNPMAGSTIGLRGAQAGAQKANAAQSYASADASKALADQRRQVTANGPGPGKVPVGYRYTRGEDGEVRLEPIPGGPKDPNAQTGKPLPASASKGYLDNLQNLDRAQKALDLVEGKTLGDAVGDPQATGLKGYLPNQLLNRVDPEGVDTRAAIADLGSLVIHDRSGAAVTAAEFPRLAPFIPTAMDNPETVRKKLKLFVQNYKALVDDSAEFYKASGYNVPALTRKNPAAVAPRTSAKPAAPGGGFTYLGKE